MFCLYHMNSLQRVDRGIADLRIGVGKGVWLVSSNSCKCKQNEVSSLVLHVARALGQLLIDVDY